ncbi:MAG: hypothetical protein RMX68_022345 [Aulosira sp. ZfuVER01]|nr:hypothetical protein [Aulosira sp. ZfuVER01]MDZ8002977.1 hypothetical protein [Aulosira sp. DedVER01a]MDZ8053508.1 hypothetical protein [Aulosira sp. ZfuCHP01]
MNRKISILLSAFSAPLWFKSNLFNYRGLAIACEGQYSLAFLVAEDLSKKTH